VSERPATSLERRLLILTPVGKDASLIATALAPDALSCIGCRDLEELALEVERGAAAIVIAEEALAGSDGRLAALLARQPPWSDLPVLLLTRAGADSQVAARTQRTLGNVTLLERPVRVAALVSAVRSALRARFRQYEARAHLEEREEADERKNQFLATLAHELRNPLAPIRTRSISCGLPLRTRPPCRPTRCGSSGQSHGAADRRPMDVSRITRGKIDLQKDTVNLAAVIAAAVETSRPLIDAENHALEVRCRPRICSSTAIPCVSRSVSNLLNNAAKYTDHGGRVSIAARRENHTAVVSVSDTGIGIPAESLSRVFDMFAQANAHDKRSHSGLGIGLALARSLIEMHGGSITATSAGEGKGSEFVVRLPLSSGADAGATPSVAVPRVREMQRILIVDDNRDAANTLGALLQMIGADVRVVYDGPAALEMLRAFRPSVVMLDLGMPGMDGYEVAQRIRAQPDLSGTSLIALTGWGEGVTVVAPAGRVQHHALVTRQRDASGVTSCHVTAQNSDGVGSGLVRPCRPRRSEQRPDAHAEEPDAAVERTRFSIHRAHDGSLTVLRRRIEGLVARRS
jgi:signal transduction histidine kinase